MKFLLVLTVMASTSCYHLHEHAYRDPHVTVTCIQPMFLVFPVAHAEETRWDITVNGKTYKNVRGLKPYYIKVPELDSIFFVTGTKTASFHLVNLSTKQETAIDGGNSRFGAWIGWNDPYPPGASNYIASVDANRLVLVSINEMGRERVTEYLNLKSKILEKAIVEHAK